MPRNVLFVKKHSDTRVTNAFKDAIQYLRKTYDDINIIVEESTAHELAPDFQDLVSFRAEEKALLAEKTDFVIALGGDGSILHVSSLFDQHAVPPVLSFSMGTLGFLLPYDVRAFPEAVNDVFHSRFSLALRKRLCMGLWDSRPEQCLWLPGENSCRELHFMNEMVLHRGSDPHMTTMDAFVDGEHLTRTVADGLIVSTPTGSTAYSLSSGGPIVHPSVSTMLLTPISPRSLSFRTILLPDNAQLQIFVAEDSRSQAEVSVDGRTIHTLKSRQSACVQMSPFPIPCVSFSPERNVARRSGSSYSHTDDDRSIIYDSWVHDINALLRFNTSFTPRDKSISDERRVEAAYRGNIRASPAKPKKKQTSE